MRLLKTKSSRGLPLPAIILASVLLCFDTAQAAPVTADIATKAVQGWLRQDKHPLGAHLSAKIKDTKTANDSNGAALYHVVQLDPGGYVILSADDTAEPIIAFSPRGSFNPSSTSALADLINHDLSKRAARAKLAVPNADAAKKAQRKWHAFLAGSGAYPPDTEVSNSIVVASQIMVPPLIQTLWSQQTDLSLTEACYNYYSPPNAAGSSNNDPCGCVATAMAQELYYFQYPTAAVGAKSFSITNENMMTNTLLLGGDGGGGPYVWGNMPLSPDYPTPTQAQAIGALCHDAGATVHMRYTPTNSTAYTAFVPQALTNVFKFASVAYFENINGTSGSTLLNMVNPNLDAHLPVVVGVQDGVGNDVTAGHCLVCDGYGYSTSTLFHHLNLGFAGDDDIWYALPNIQTPDNDGYNVFEACVYNIYTNGSGQIMSGRVTDPFGAPVAGATVTGVRNGGGTYTVTTDTNGIYALARVPAGIYTVTANNTGFNSASGTYSNSAPGGNVWGANFVLSQPLLATPENGFSSIGPVGGPADTFSVQSTNFTLTNSTASSISWTIANPTAWLAVTPTNGILAANSTVNFSVALTNVSSLAAGTNVGAIWITNLTSGTSQALTFTLLVETADYPIAVTGYNADVIVENAAAGGSTSNYSSVFDSACSFLRDSGDNPISFPVCFYENGLAVSNIIIGISDTSASGLPVGGQFTSLADGKTVFQFGPYQSNNVLFLTQESRSASLTLPIPAAYGSLSVLAASAQGGGSGTMVLHFDDGTSSQAIPFNAATYLTSNAPSAGAAITNFGLLVTGNYNVYGTINDPQVFPSLYQTPIDLAGLGDNTKLITNITFTMPANAPAGAVTGVFALSGTEAVYTGNYKLTVRASPSVGGTVTGGGSFPAGSTNTVTAAANADYVFTNWAANGVVVSTSTNYTFVLSGDETLVANFLTYYTLNNTVSPSNGGTVSEGGTYLQGTTVNVYATNNPGFEFIGWSGGGTGTENPLAVTITTNLNIVANFASNNGNISFTVVTNVPGFGTVTPNLNGKILTPNHNYTLTAKPAKGILFSNWTGSIATNKNPLTFKATTNMVLQANFVTNPFLGLAGTYNGLFFDTNNGVSEASAGMLKGLTLNQEGKYSGSLLIAGGSHGLSGSLSLGGQATNIVSRPASQGGPIKIVMTVSGATPPPQITGAVIGTNGGIPWQASLVAGRATNTVPNGEFTLLIPPDFDNFPPASSPGGDGYLLITNKAGTATMAGALADGTALSQSVGVSQDGYIPLYDNLYSGKGLLLGWINLYLTNTDDVSLTWIRLPQRSGLYTNGFVNFYSADQFTLSPWTNFAANYEVLTNLLTVQTANSNAPGLFYGVRIESAGQIIDTATEKSIGSVTPKTGVFSVTFGNVKGHGAITLVNGTNGGGYFTTKTNAQAILLLP